MIKWWISAVFWLGNLHRRVLAVFFTTIGPRLSYRLTGWGSLLLYRLLDPLRIRSEALCRAALYSHVRSPDVPRIAERSFVNRAKNLTDLMLASRLLRADTYERYGGRIPEPFLGDLLQRQRRAQPTILLTAYYGSFDLLPIFLGYNGIRASVVYLPHSNAGFDSYRRSIRGKSGCEMVAVKNAAARLGQVLGHGGTVALVADHHVEDRGTPVTFLGLQTKALRSVGLLAWRYEADVVVAAIRRLGDDFQFRLAVADVVHHNETTAHDDPVAFVTDRYLRAIERLILEDPTQYLWAYARWGADHARRATHDLESGGGQTQNSASAPPSGVGNGETEINGRIEIIE